jgi:nicotinamidase-related amidase
MTSVLLLIDVQRNMLEPPTPVPAAAAISAAIDDLLGKARAAESLVIYVRNNGGQDDPDAPGSPGWELIHQVQDGEHIVDKHEPDAFAGTGLPDLIPASASVVVAGMQSEYCVRATSLSALRRGHPVALVRGAHATYDGEASADAISRRVEEELSAAGAAVVSVQEARFS